MKDRDILQKLVTKYGKDVVLDTINEAFSSDKLQGYASKIKKHNREVNDKAKADRLSKMNRLAKRHFDPEGFDGDTRDLGWRDRHDDPKENRKNYEENIRHISYDFDRYIRDHKLDSFKSMMYRYGLGDIDWAEVKDTDFGEMDKYDAKRLARNPRWNQYILFWERHDGSIYAISRGSVVVYVKRPIGFYRDEAKIKDLVDNSNVARVFCLDISKIEKLRDKKQTDRRVARDGMIDRNEATNDQIRYENISRYKRIIAQNHIDKFDKVDKDVRTAIKNSAKFFTDSDDMKAVFKLNKLIEKLLVYYESFCYNRDRLKNLNSYSDKSRWSYNANDYNSALSAKISEINDVIEEINTLLA